MPDSALKAALDCKCPRCREGDLFLYGPYELGKFLKMPEHCPKCGLKYEIETGFFWGAMYITYAFVTGLFLIALFIFFFLRTKFEFTTVQWLLGFLAIYLPIVLLLIPLMNRYGRVAMLYLFGSVDYDPHAIEKYERGEHSEQPS